MVGGEMKVLYRRATPEVGVGDMACIPAGAESTWHLATSFVDLYVLS